MQYDATTGDRLAGLLVLCFTSPDTQLDAHSVPAASESSGVTRTHPLTSEKRLYRDLIASERWSTSR